MPPEPAHGLVTPVVDAVDEAGEAQHVFGHALAPLPACGGARQRLAERLRGLGEHLGLAPRLARAGRCSAPDVLPTLALDLVQHAGEAGQLGPHVGHLQVDALTGPGELLRAEPALPVEHLLVHAYEPVDRAGEHRLVGRRPRRDRLAHHRLDRHRGRRRLPAGAGQRDREHDHSGEGRGGQDGEQHFHGGHGTAGV